MAYEMSIMGKDITKEEAIAKYGKETIEKRLEVINKCFLMDPSCYGITWEDGMIISWEDGTVVVKE